MKIKMYFYIKDNDLELESGKRNCQLSLLMRANESRLTFCLSNSIVGAFYVPKVIASALSRHVNLRSALAVIFALLAALMKRCTAPTKFRCPVNCAKMLLALN